MLFVRRFDLQHPVIVYRRLGRPLSADSEHDGRSRPLIRSFGPAVSTAAAHRLQGFGVPPGVSRTHSRYRFPFRSTVRDNFVINDSSINFYCRLPRVAVRTVCTVAFQRVDCTKFVLRASEKSLWNKSL